MAYSNIMLKGCIGYTGDWALIVLERAKSDKPLTPVFCEVFGLEHESGSCYYKDIVLTNNLYEWEHTIEQMGHIPFNRYYKGQLRHGILSTLY